MLQAERIHVIDSHTAGEPTRVVISGGPPLGNGPLGHRLALFRDNYDHYRSAIVEEPRGSEAIVGALLCEPCNSECAAGVIFFNNVGYLGMCGHGSIGLGATLAYLGRCSTGIHKIETPVGIVEIEIHSSCEVTVSNVPSYRLHAGVQVEVAGFGRVVGDIAWGGNWFFLTSDYPLPLAAGNIKELTKYCWLVRTTLQTNRLTGTDGEEIDHIELVGPSSTANSRNFVLCPGGSYDRSPCGTGTSAKLACLHADGKMLEGQTWHQESIIGSLFEGSFLIRNGLLHPRIRGSAFVNAESHLVLQDKDPFCWGIAKEEVNQ